MLQSSTLFYLELRSRRATRAGLEVPGIIGEVARGSKRRSFVSPGSSSSGLAGLELPAWESRRPRFPSVYLQTRISGRSGGRRPHPSCLRSVGRRGRPLRGREGRVRRRAGQEDAQEVREGDDQAVPVLPPELWKEEGEVRRLCRELGGRGAKPHRHTRPAGFF